ncbi:MAG TPA: TolC family protein [Pirellulales bacterium]|nr:TolC family protein [Pirellulales bacterium]
MMTKRSYANVIGLIALGIAVNLTAGVATRGEDLQQAWQMALSANPQLRAARFNSGAAGLNSSAARRDLLPTGQNVTADLQLSQVPTINSSQGGGFQFPLLGSQTNIPLSLTSISQPIYAGGRIRNGIDQADAQYGQQRAEQIRTALDLKLNVAETYVGVLQARRDLDVAKSNLSRLQSFLADVKNRKRVGMATRNEELAAEVSLANARLREIQGRNEVYTAWARYNRYLMQPLDRIVPLEEVSVPRGEGSVEGLTHRALRVRPEFATLDDQEIAALTSQAVRRRPELASLSQQARALRAQAQVTRSGVRPQVNLNGAYIYFGDNSLSNQNIWAATATINWKFFDGGASRRRAQALEQQQRAVMQQRADAAAGVALEVRTRWLDLDEARQRVAVSKVAIDQAEENMNVVQDRYREQLSTYTEVLDAENQRVEAYANFYRATYDEALAFFRLRRAVGDL